MNRIKVNFIISFLVICFLLISNAKASILTAHSCSMSDVQSQVNAAKDGDIVAIPAGSCTWSSTVSWSNKNITIQGAGKGITVINSGGFGPTITDVTKASWRISGLTLQSSSSAPAPITIYAADAPSYTSGWRIDNINFNYAGDTPSGGIIIYGVTYGLFDHCDFSFSHSVWIYVEMAQYTSWPSSDSKYEQCWGSPTINQVCGRYNLSQPLDLGTEKAIYWEDCTFTSRSSTQAFFDTSYGGARVVFRHNTLTGGFIYAHWTRTGEINPFKIELYNNNIVGNANWNAYPVRFEGGTGVIFNNQVTGYSNGWFVDERRGGAGENSGILGACNGSQAWDGNAGDGSAPGWPCLAQVGRDFGKTWEQIRAGDKPGSAPMYAWNNGAQDGCRTGGTCTNSTNIYTGYGSTAYVKATAHPNGQVDYVNNGSTPKPTYKPYIYPHPLQGTGGGDILPAPGNLRITQ